MVLSMSSAASGVTASLVNEGFEESRMEPELRQRTGGPGRRVLAFEPSVRQVMVHMRVPSECEEKVEAEQERQRPSSCRLTRSSVRGVLSRDTANKGNPFLRAGEGVRCRSPRRASSDTTLPTETFRSLASERAVSRISSSMFRVVLTPDTLAS